jgi:geranylgeranyl pyrophosphate synthase|tara:strand:+ start:6777 stop:7658 length:882 start_codon:yes stop_codon:yes gene_type:complete
MTDFVPTLKKMRELVEASLPAALPSPNTRPQRLHEAMHYSLLAGGKRLRPIMTIACAQLFPRLVDPLPAALSVELLHTYTLIHDDLPAMDDSDLRRGRATVHKAYDEVTGILAGDALLTEAFALLARSYGENPQIGLKLVHELGSASGSQQLIGGQTEDTAAENTEISAEDLDFIHLNKTAALIEASCRMGLHCSETPASAFDTMTTAARSLGLAFQILDDILDVTASTEDMGKTVRADAANAKNTYVAFHGLEASRATAARLTDEALKALRSIEADTGFLEALFKRLLERKH